MPRVVKDPTDPSFPHGSERGYSRGCRTERDCPRSPRSCLWAHTVGCKRRAYARSQGRPVMVDAAPVLAHVAALLDGPEPWRSAKTVARAAGLADRAVVRWNRADKPAHIHRPVAEAVLAVTEDRMRAVAPWVPTYPYLMMRRSMQAIGWSMRWQARMLRGGERVRDTALDMESQAYISRDLAERIAVLFRSYGNVPGPCARARREAHAAGYYPPACYDDDWTLIPAAVRRADRHEAWAEQQEQAAAQRIRAAALTVEGRSADAIAAAVGCSERSVVRWRATLRLSVSVDPGTGRAVVGAHNPDLPAAVRDAWTAVHLHHADAVTEWEALVAMADADAIREAA